MNTTPDPRHLMTEAENLARSIASNKREMDDASNAQNVHRGCINNLSGHHNPNDDMIAEHEDKIATLQHIIDDARTKNARLKAELETIHSVMDEFW